jgi:hypothetical protein
MQKIRKLTTILRRFVLSYKYNKENFTLKKSKNVFLEIKNKNFGNPVNQFLALDQQ